MTATIIVEDGTKVANANSYISVANFQTYASDRGITISGTEEDLLIQAMDYLENLDFKGYRLTEDQALEWPRSEVPKFDIYWYDTDEIPQLLIDGLCEVALAIDAGNSPLSNIDKSVKREKVDVLEIEYRDGGNDAVIVRKIMNKLKDLLRSNRGGISFVVDRA